MQSPEFSPASQPGSEMLSICRMEREKPPLCLVTCQSQVSLHFAHPDPENYLSNSHATANKPQRQSPAHFARLRALPPDTRHMESRCSAEGLGVFRPKKTRGSESNRDQGEKIKNLSKKPRPKEERQAYEQSVYLRSRTESLSDPKPNLSTNNTRWLPRYHARSCDLTAVAPPSFGKLGKRKRLAEQGRGFQMRRSRV